MKNNNIILLLRVPFLEKIPSLKTMVLYFAEQGFNIKIISSYDKQYPMFGNTHRNIKYSLVKKRTRKFGIPTSLKLIYKFLLEYFSHKPACIIGGDVIANDILSRIVPFRYVNFLLEYPTLGNLSEEESLKKSKYIITHDKWHLDFLIKEYNLDKNRILLLPNSSYTPQNYKKSKYIYESLNIRDEKKIILHSGGLGKWFLSKELAKSVMNWPDNYILVFHTSHFVKDTPYYKEMISDSEYDINRVYFSINPLPNEELDELISSTYIGVALYSIEELGYRAKYMGLAAGKIGNYLKCGIPVIATKLESLKYIEDYKCGVLIDDMKNIKNAIEYINLNYKEYSDNAHKCYSELWEPQRYLEDIRKTLFD